MTDQPKDRELFGVWFAKENTPHTVHDFDKTHIETMFIGFQAARAIDKAETRKWINKWEALKLKHDLMLPISKDLEQQLSAALAVIEQKDAALKFYANDKNFSHRCQKCGELDTDVCVGRTAQEALALHASTDALKEHDARVLEEASVALDGGDRDCNCCRNLDAMADKLRATKKEVE